MRIVGFILMLSLVLGGCASKKNVVSKTDDTPSADAMIPAYYYAKYENVATVKAKLSDAGFEIVGSYVSTTNSETIIVTDAAMKLAAAEPGKGFAAIERILVDHEHQRVALTNPVYFGKAFLQDAFNYDTAKAELKKLEDALGILTSSEDAYEYGALGTYQFMVGMPEYNDFFILGEGENQALLTRLQKYEQGQKLLFTLDLGEGKTLVGYALNSQTAAFVQKIGSQNAQLLPYTILIENGRAVALAAKYYIALCYPLLSMGEFMTIASTPGAIEKELEAPFK